MLHHTPWWTYPVLIPFFKVPADFSMHCSISLYAASNEHFFSFRCFTAFVLSRTINILYSNVWTVWQLYFILLGLTSRLILCYNAICDPSLAIFQQCILLSITDYFHIFQKGCWFWLDFLFLLSEHIMCILNKESIVIMRKFDFEMLIYVYGLRSPEFVSAILR